MVEEIEYPVLQDVPKVEALEYESPAWGQDFDNPLHEGVEVVYVGNDIVRGDEFRLPYIVALAEILGDRGNAALPSDLRKFRVWLKAGHFHAKRLESLKDRAVVRADVDHHVAFLQAAEVDQASCERLEVRSRRCYRAGEENMGMVKLRNLVQHVDKAARAALVEIEVVERLRFRHVKVLIAYGRRSKREDEFQLTAVADAAVRAGGRQGTCSLCEGGFRHEGLLQYAGTWSAGSSARTLAAASRSRCPRTCPPSRLPRP